MLKVGITTMLPGCHCQYQGGQRELCLAHSTGRDVQIAVIRSVHHTVKRNSLLWTGMLSDSSEGETRHRFRCKQGQYAGKLVLFIFLGKLSILPTLPGSLPDPRNLSCRKMIVEASNRQHEKNNTHTS